LKGAVVPFRFRKSFKIFPGVRLNLNSKSTSVTFGSGRVHETLSSTGSVRIGDGLSWRKTSKRRGSRG
jgi:hypothetical protein